MSGRDPLRVGLSYAWAFLPLLSLGFVTPLVFFFAATRLKYRSLWIACALYTGALVIEQVTAPNYQVVADVALAALTLGATGHALAIRAPVFFGRSKPSAMELAVDTAEERRRLRETARDLAAGDPALALELRVGRPDLARDYDDGGVVDVNHAPADVLASLPGVTREHAELIVRLREEHGGFVSANELCVFAELPPEVTTSVTERTVFLPDQAPSS
ncbi:helix-hairpin-helix protein [Kribbella sp. VKM Ac-2571]|nr:helix-hairpin-helix protein [Kribbella sp. VKM Ac-2571]